MTPGQLAELLGKKAPKRLAELAEAMSIVGYRYTLNIVIDEAGIPEHMAPTVAVIAAPDKPPVGDAAFSLRPRRGRRRRPRRRDDRARCSPRKARSSPIA